MDVTTQTIKRVIKHDPVYNWFSSWSGYHHTKKYTENTKEGQKTMGMFVHPSESDFKVILCV